MMVAIFILVLTYAYLKAHVTATPTLHDFVFPITSLFIPALQLSTVATSNPLPRLPLISSFCRVSRLYTISVFLPCLPLWLRSFSLTISYDLSVYLLSLPLGLGSFYHRLRGLVFPLDREVFSTTYHAPYGELKLQPHAWRSSGPRKKAIVISYYLMVTRLRMMTACDLVNPYLDLI